jgi:alkyl hydroperoxide reductase subunit AhpF
VISHTLEEEGMTVAMLKDEDREQVRKRLDGLVNPVQLVMFTQTLECEFCAQTHALVEEVAALSDKVEGVIYDLVLDKDKADDYGVDKIPDKADDYGVDKIPAIAVMGQKDYGVRFYGMPAGYEFASLLEAIDTVSTGESGLSEATKEALAQIDEAVHFEVFVTPT